MRNEKASVKGTSDPLLIRVSACSLLNPRYGFISWLTLKNVICQHVLGEGVLYLNAIC